MNTTTQPKENVATHAVDLASWISFVVGIDGEGNTHIHYPGADRVEVYGVATTAAHELRAKEPNHVDDLDGRPLPHWFGFVENYRGEWTETTHHAPEGF